MPIVHRYDQQPVWDNVDIYDAGKTRPYEVYQSIPSRGDYFQPSRPFHQNSGQVLTLASSSSNEINRTISRQLDDLTFLRGCLQPFLPSLLVSPWPEDNTPFAHGNSQFLGWSQAIYGGGHPAWGRCQVIHMAPNPPFAERCAAALQDNGWLASDEALWFMRKLQEWRSDIQTGPIVQWSPSRDLQHLMAAEDPLQFTNHRLNLLLFLVEAHWCAIEIDRRTDPVHMVLIQWPPQHHTMVILEMSRILQIPPHRMLVTMDSNNEALTMCGWTTLFRWYQNLPRRHVSNL